MLTDDDLKFRRTKIGASDAAIILGISPWKKPRDLWLEKKFGSKQTTMPWMKRGNDLEPVALKLFEDKTGLLMMPVRKISKVYEWQIATFDGMTFDEDNIVEIKCPNKKVHKMAKEGELPNYYFAQVQHQLCVAGLDMAYYFTYDGDTTAMVKVKRDQAYIDSLIEAELKFWHLMQLDDLPDCLQEYA